MWFWDCHAQFAMQYLIQVKLQAAVLMLVGSFAWLQDVRVANTTESDLRLSIVNVLYPIVQMTRFMQGGPSLCSALCCMID